MHEGGSVGQTDPGMTILAIDLRVNTRQREARLPLVIELQAAPLRRRAVASVATTIVLIPELAAMDIEVAGRASAGGAAIAEDRLGGAGLRAMALVTLRLSVRAGQSVARARQVIERTNRERGPLV